GAREKPDRERRPAHTGQQADPGELAEEHAEDRPLRPAERGQRPDLGSSRPRDRERAVREEERADDDDQREQREALAIEGVQEDDRDALLRPALAQEERRLPEAPLRKRDQPRVG